VAVHREAFPAFIAHHLDDLLGAIFLFLDLLERKDSIDFVRNLAADGDDLDGQIGPGDPVRRLVDHRDTERIPRVRPLFWRKPALKSFGHGLDVARKSASLFEDRPLIGAESHELERDGEAPFEGVFGAEQVLDRVVEVDAARLKLRADGVVDPVG
jgi:hypothetical protein